MALLEHVISLGKVNLGEDDPDLLAAAHHLARVFQRADDPAAARRVLEEAYAAGQWRLGDSYPLMLEISYDLGVVAEELGNRHEARKALSRVVELGTPVLGDFHWAVLKARAYLDGNVDALTEPITGMDAPPRGGGPGAEVTAPIVTAPIVTPPVQEPAATPPVKQVETPPAEEAPAGGARPVLPRRVPAYQQDDGTYEREALPKAYADAIGDLPTQLHPVIKVEPEPDRRPHAPDDLRLGAARAERPGATGDVQVGATPAGATEDSRRAAEKQRQTEDAGRAAEKQRQTEDARQAAEKQRRTGAGDVRPVVEMQRAAADVRPEIVPRGEVRDLGVQRLEPRYDRPDYERLPVPRPRLPEHQPPPPAPPVTAVTHATAAAAPQPYPSKRGPAIFAAIAAALAAIIAVVALVFVLIDRDEATPVQPDQPVLGGGPPPSDVTLRDFGSSMEISWSDPGEGKTSFIIAGGHPGEVLKPMGEVGPGVTSFRLQGLNDQLDYCFAVFAVYSTTEFASSPQSCTSRPGPRPSD